MIIYHLNDFLHKLVIKLMPTYEIRQLVACSLMVISVMMMIFGLGIDYAWEPPTNKAHPNKNNTDATMNLFRQDELSETIVSPRDRQKSTTYS